MRRATRLCESLSPSHGENMFQVFLLSYQNLYLGSLFLVLEALSAHVFIVSTAACNHYNYISVPSEYVFVSILSLSMLRKYIKKQRISCVMYNQT